jgi:hypothetical protein
MMHMGRCMSKRWLEVINVKCMSGEDMGYDDVDEDIHQSDASLPKH